MTRRALEEQRQRLLALAHAWVAISLNPYDHPVAAYEFRVGWTKKRSTGLEPKS